jgi:alpha-1,4-digalacturonate transport system substrate-binding protein
MTRHHLTTTALAAALGAAAMGASAQEVRFMCYSDGNECEVYDDLLSRFEAQNEGVTITVDTVPYQAILDNLPVQLAAGTAPDMAKVTDLGGLSDYYLDLTPYVDADYWQENFGSTLPWYRGDRDEGIFGMHSQLTITGPYINATLFEQAGVEIPGADATWEEWAEAAREVRDATGVQFAMAMDRSGHRIAGPAISYGAALFGEDGEPILVDEGFKDYVAQFVAWHEDGTMPRDVWGGAGGATPVDAAQEFINGELVYYYSGSWNTGRMEEQIGDFFDWQVVGSPCGAEGVCTGMPGGAGIVGFEQSDNPELVARIIDFLAQEEIYAEAAARTLNIPAHAGVAAEGVEYQDVSEQAAEALNAWGSQVGGISPTAFAYQGYANNRAMFNITTERVSQAVVGELTVDEAMDRMREDLAAAMAEIKQQ